MDKTSKRIVRDLLELSRASANNDAFAASAAAQSQSVGILLRATDQNDEMRDPLENLESRIDEFKIGKARGDDVRAAFVKFEDAWRQSPNQSRSQAFALPTLQAIVSIVATVVTMIVGSSGVLNFLSVKARSGTPTGASAASVRYAPTEQDVLLHSVQVLLILVLALAFEKIFMTDAKRQARARHDDRVVGALRQFALGWRWIYLSWLWLYTWLALSSWLVLHGVVTMDECVVFSVCDVINMSSSVAFLYTFAVLDLPSVRIKPSDDTKAFTSFVSGCVGIGAFVCVLSICDRLSYPFAFNGLGVGLNALFAGLSMTFLIGRLDSHIINLGRLWLGLMYLYALIQAYYPVALGNDPNIRTALFVTALLLKAALFIIVGHLCVQRGALTRFLAWLVARDDARLAAAPTNGAAIKTGPSRH
jgi:hypothetical protein